MCIIWSFSVFSTEVYEVCFFLHVIYINLTFLLKPSLLTAIRLKMKIYKLGYKVEDKAIPLQAWGFQGVAQHTWAMATVPLEPETSFFGFDIQRTAHHDKKSNPITGLDRPWGFQEVEAPRFQDSRHMRVVSRKHRPPLPPVNIPGTHFC